MPDKIICNKCNSEKHPFYGKDFTNQKIAANLYKDTNNSFKSGETYTFVVWHRQDIKNYLDYKKG